VALEVVEAYKDGSNRVMENPVGTGAYRLKEWTRGQHILLEANPDYRDVTFPGPGAGSTPTDAAIAKGLVCRKLPLIGNIDISIIEEAQPRLLAFDSGKLDYYVMVPPTLASNVLRGTELKPEYAKRGVVLHREAEPAISFLFFNLDNPLVGGYTPEKLALRRAISMGFDRQTAIAQWLKGTALPGTKLVPPLYGHDLKYVALWLRSRRGALVARQVWLQGSRWRWLSRAAGWQASDPCSRFDDGRRSAGARRTVEAQHGRAGPSHHVPQEQMAGVEQDVRGRTTDDVGPGLDQRRA
jgi:hypothetical protein